MEKREEIEGGREMNQTIPRHYYIPFILRGLYRAAILSVNMCWLVCIPINNGLPLL